MKAIIQHIEIAKQTLSAQEESLKRSRKSGFAAILDMSSWFQDDSNMGDLSPSEVKKLHSYLDTAAANISYIFEVSYINRNTVVQQEAQNHLRFQIGCVEAIKVVKISLPVLIILPERTRHEFFTFSFL